MTDVVRRIQIQASQTGASETAAALNKIATAQDSVAVATAKTERATVSMQGKIVSLQKSLDSEYAAEAKMASIEKTLTAARNEGLISIQRENELLTLAAEKYRVTGESAKAMGEGLKTAKELAMGLIGGLGAGFAIAGIAELPGKIMDAVHEAAGLGHVAETIGITTKALQELQFTGAEFHVSTETMDAALEKFSKNLGVAATGSGELAKILKANHVVISGDLTKDLANYANLIRNASNEQDRNLLSTTAFGKAAQEMGLLFSEGAKGIKEGADAADAAGAVLSGPALKAAQDLDKQFVDMKVQMDVTFKDFAISTAPLVIKALGGITAAVKTLASTTVNWDLVNQQGATFGGRFGQFRPNVKPPTNDNTPPQITVRGATPLGLHDGDTAYRQLTTTTPTIIPKVPDAGALAAEKAIKAVTDALNLQLKTLTETDRQKEIDNELSKAKVTSSSAEGKAITALAGKYYDEKKAIAEANQEAAFFAQTMATAFEGIVDGSTSVTDALANIVKALEQAVIQAALLGSGPLANIFGGAPTTSGGTGGILGSLLSGLHLGTNAMGGVYSSPDLSAYRNQVVDHPTMFRFASGGVFGEAGPEAIMPLSRGSDGRLGVVSSGNDNGLELNVQIVHQPGASDSATAKKDGNKLNLVALVGDAASQSLKTPGSSMNRTLRVGFGARPALTRRGG